MLPFMTAAVVFARRGKGVAAGAMVAAAMMAKQTGAATLLPVLFLLARRRGKRGVGEVALGFTVPTALVALAVGPAQLVYWAVLGNGSYVGVDTASALVLAMFVVMTLGVGRCATCHCCGGCRAPGATARVRAADGQTDTDLWLWALSAAVAVAFGFRFFGHYYLQLVPPVTLLAAGALARSARWMAARDRRVSRW